MVNQSIQSIQSSQSIDFIIRFGNRLNIKKKYITIATRISDNINKLDIASDHQPPSVAAGSILLMANIHKLNLSKRTISKKFDISEVTITKTFKKIYKYQKS